MSRVVQFMRDLVAKGMSWEDAAAFAERFEDNLDIPLAAAISPALEKKRLRDAERMRLKRGAWAAKERDVAATSPSTVASDVVNDRRGDKAAPAPVHTRGENNLSRLEDTCSAAVAEAREPISDWPAGDAHHHAKLLVAEASTVRLDPSRQTMLVTTAGRLDAWKRDGASWVYDVVPAVTMIARARGSPIKTWKFFDDAIAQSIADNRRALQIPSAANGPRHERPDPRSAKLDAKQANMDRALRGAQMAIARRAV